MSLLMDALRKAEEAKSKKVNAAAQDLTLIAGQRAVVTRSKKSIANFKLREDMGIGCKVTLRYQLDKDCATRGPEAGKRSILLQFCTRYKYLACCSLYVFKTIAVVRRNLHH